MCLVKEFYMVRVVQSLSWLGVAAVSYRRKKKRYVLKAKLNYRQYKSISVEVEIIIYKTEHKKMLV